MDDRSRIVLANRTLTDWLGFDTADVVGKNPDLMPVAGRMFFETNFSPLLRMQGFFHAVALDFVCKDGKRLPVLANARQTANTGRRVTKNSGGLLSGHEPTQVRARTGRSQPRATRLARKSRLWSPLSHRPGYIARNSSRSWGTVFETRWLRSVAACASFGRRT